MNPCGFEFLPSSLGKIFALENILYRLFNIINDRNRIKKICLRCDMVPWYLS